MDKPAEGRRHDTRPPRPGLTLIRWELTRGRRRLVCQVDREPDSNAFAVIVMSYRNLRRAYVEHFGAVTAALGRHAMLAARLRADGWSVGAYTR